MEIRALENIINDNTLIVLKVEKAKKKIEEYEMYFHRILELYYLYDVIKISTTFEGELHMVIRDYRI